jgi:hypothetical protein
VDALEKWVNILEGYILVYNYHDRENITFSFFNAIPCVKDWWETYYEQTSTKESEMFWTKPTWESFVDALKGK